MQKRTDMRKRQPMANEESNKYAAATNRSTSKSIQMKPLCTPKDLAKKQVILLLNLGSKLVINQIWCSTSNNTLYFAEETTLKICWNEQPF
jgi:hypothetical protein